jgi:hypothetical protein
MPVLRSVIPRWTATAHATASTTLGNSQEQPVARGLDDSPLVFANFWIDQFAAMSSEPRKSAGFVLAHEP